MSIMSRPRSVVRRLDLPRRAWVGIALATAVLLLALLGPLLAPNDPDSFVGVPFTAPSLDYPMGLDYLGRDAWSRFLSGGRTGMLLALLGFAAGSSIGLALGLTSAYSRGRTGRIIDRASEILVGFPSLIMLMLVVAGLGVELWVIVVALAVVHIPRVTRIVRAAGLDVRNTAYVEVAEARGETRLYVMFREMLPGVMPSFLVNAGIGVPASILLVASLSFLGLGIQPPLSDWGLIISENRDGLTTQPWPVIPPVLALTILMIGVNVAVDGFHRVRSRDARTGAQDGALERAEP